MSSSLSNSLIIFQSFSISKLFPSERAKWYSKCIIRKKYGTDLTDEQWDVIAPLFVNMRKYKWKLECQWRNLPYDFPPALHLVKFSADNIHKNYDSRGIVLIKKTPP